MDLRQLEYFVAVADECNFTKAALRCHVVQSALSHQIARLEREHGIRLFHRTSRSVRLAPAGEVLLPHARALLQGAELARAELAAFSGLITGRLRLGMVGSVGRAAPLVEDALIAFHTRHPGVEIAAQDTGSRHMAGQVQAGELDLAFVGLFAGQAPDGLVHHLLTDEPLVAVVARSHPLAGNQRASLGELADHGPFIDMRPESGLRLQVDAAFDRAGIARRVAFEVGSSDGVVRFVGLGFGAALVPASAIGAAAEVSVLRLDDPDARHPIGLVHPRPRPAAPSARAFLDLVLEATGAAHRG
ncbi:LysR family transcriptional regulator [Blastococcus sp. CT_GayMR19]|uniref:LysR family transcriptional regulator n=1 Tax=Blastococcus sp. CT_GayMR19 TaxID=2559608 RepID=UPI001073892C|nr:LysR family transcriptional regulator [Blastococcus sp. CT_GayMR19]TFV77631.1 LysR family transcriptional regulator [Blastococcus sp. CT_GayMR19]